MRGVSEPVGIGLKCFVQSSWLVAPIKKKKKKSWLVAGVCYSGPSILRVVELVKHLGFWALTVWVQAIQS